MLERKIRTELDQSKYPLKIIKDLGTQLPSKHSKWKLRYALFECPICKNSFKSATKSVAHGKTTKCKDCRKLSKKSESTIQSGMKMCGTCKTEKSLEHFYNNKTSKDGKGTRCKECDSIARRKYYEENEKGRENSYIRHREHYLSKTYGISLSQYSTLLEEQNYSCKLCKIPLALYQEQYSGKKGLDERSKFFAVDHCHSTGKIRGLLCSNCNTGLGKLGDTVENLKKAYEYLLNNS